MVSGNKPNTVDLCDDHNTPIHQSDCCKVLNDFFASCFSCTLPNVFPQPCTTDFLPMDPITIDSVGVTCLIERQKISSCSGIDGITTKFLKSTSTCSSLILREIFEQSLQSCSIPLDWKVGKVVPLHKSGSNASILNYRPISLTSVPCKLLEHIIYSHLITFLETNKFFNSCQHGFRKFFFV